MAWVRTTASPSVKIENEYQYRREVLVQSHSGFNGHFAETGPRPISQANRSIVAPLHRGPKAARSRIHPNQAAW